MNDILPEEQVSFQHVAGTFKTLAAQAGFGRIETPVLEDTGVFKRAVGEATDIVEKEMYTFPDRSGNSLTMRPEGTAGVARAYIEHGMASWPQPVKLYYTSPMFRYERPQAGRTRQHTQIGAEIFGESQPSADAHIITLASRLYRKLGLLGVTLQVNSIGDGACRPKYLGELTSYLKEHQSKLCEQCQSRISKNPMRVLDCKEKGCQPIIADAPQTLNFLCQACHQHFTGVLEYLDDLEVPYELNHKLVRGLDYYTRTVFEFYGGRAGAQSSIGAGGRYDDLVDQLGGKPTPAIGFGSSLERITLEMSECGLEPPPPQDVRVYVASLGEPARLASFRLIEELLDGGVGAAGAVDKNGIQAQLGRADRLGTPYAIIIGQKEVFDKTVILRDMTSGAQEMVPLEKIVAEVQKRFGVK